MKVNKMKNLSKVFPIFFFSFLSSLIVFPLFYPGYILTMDIAFIPKLPMPSLFSPSFFFGSLLWLLNIFIPSYILQKIMLYLIFFLSGWGMYRFVSKKYGGSGIYGGIFYAINPYVYERVMAGQWQFLLGYSILPFIVSSIINFYDEPNRKNTSILGVWSYLLISLAIHFTLVLLVILLIYGFIHAFYNKGKLLTVVRHLTLYSAILILLNANWLLPTILGTSDVSQIISLFDSSDLTAFQSIPDKNFGLIFNLLSGYGFWPETYDYFISPKSIIFVWPVLSLLLISLSLYGLYKMFMDKEKSSFPEYMTFFVLFLISLDLAGGVALKSFGNSIYYLYEKLPLLRGFREPQKLVGVIMFCYAFFGSVGLNYLSHKVKKSSMFSVLCSLFFVLPFVYTPTVFGGFWGQLKPVFYPESWSKVNNIITQDKNDYIVIFFPWHQYARFRFNGNRIAVNPAEYYFSKPVLSSKNYETASLDTHDQRPEALHVEGLLSIEKTGINLLGDTVDQKIMWGESLSPIGAKYVILAKEEDWSKYKFLDDSSDLVKIYDDNDLILYQNMSWGKEDLFKEEKELEFIPDLEL